MTKPLIRADVRKGIQSGDLPWLRANLPKLNCKFSTGPRSSCTTKRDFNIMDEYSSRAVPLARDARLGISLQEKEIWFKSSIFSDGWYTVLIRDKDADGRAEAKKGEIFFCRGLRCRVLNPLDPKKHEDPEAMKSLLAAAEKAYKSVLKAAGLME